MASTVGKSRVLVVDDDEIAVAFLSDLLAADGHEVEAAGSGGEALARVSAGGIELVIADRTLADMPAVDLVREVARRSPDTRVIVITARGTIEDAVELVQAGADDFVLRPEDDALTFLARVRRATTGRRREAKAAEEIEPKALPRTTREALHAVRETLDGRRLVAAAE